MHVSKKLFRRALRLEEEAIKKGIPLTRKLISDRLGVNDNTAKFLKYALENKHLFVDRNDLVFDVTTIAEIERRFQKLRNEVAHWKRKYRELLKSRSMEDRFLEMIEELIPALPPVKPVSPSPCHEVPIVRENLTLILSDFHIGEVVSSEETMGFNGFDFPEFIRRVRNVFGNTIDIAINKLRGYRFDVLNIDFLGDIVSGTIHDELVENSDLTVVEAVILGAHVVAQAISFISGYFPLVHVHGVIGNHGRLTRKKKFKKTFNNFDFMFYQVLRILLSKHQNITFEFPRAWMFTYENNGHVVAMLHGDSVRSWAGIPWYGIQRAVSRLFQMLAKQGTIVDIWEIGHFHQDASVPDNVLINGSLIGPSEYSIQNLQSASPAMQKLYGCHPEHGITFMYRINPLVDSKVEVPVQVDHDDLVPLGVESGF